MSIIYSMSKLQLQAIPQNLQVTVNLSWSALMPVGTIDYLIFYHPVGTSHIKSLSTTNLTVIIQNLQNDVQYSIQATAYQVGYINGSALRETSDQLPIPGTVADAPTT